MSLLSLMVAGSEKTILELVYKCQVKEWLLQ